MKLGEFLKRALNKDNSSETGKVSSHAKPKPEHLKIGQMGEDIAVKHFVKHGYRILDRNYRKKFGEIDIIAFKSGVVHFIEVKSVSHETQGLRPEENIHSNKMRRLENTINSYISEKFGEREVDIQVDAAIVVVNQNTESRIEIIENILLGQ